MLAKHALSQLSYGPKENLSSIEPVVGLGGLEPPTSRLSSARSNQLSYKPVNQRQIRSSDLLRSNFSRPIERETKTAGPAKCGSTKPLIF